MYLTTVKLGSLNQGRCATKKPLATDNRFLLYLRGVVSTQCHRTAILLAFSGIIFDRKHITAPALVDDTSCKESREGTIGQAPR